MTTRKTTAGKRTSSKQVAAKKSAPAVATIMETGDRAKAEKGYAEHVEGWADLPKRQRDAIIELTVAYRTRPTSLEMTVERSEAGGYSIGAVQGDSPTYHALKMADTFASTSASFSTDKLNDLINHFAANSNKGARALDLNSAVAFINGAKPQNEVETTLAVQMVATNDAAMRALAMIGKSEWVPQTQLFGNLAVKLLRTFTAQAEALAKLQRGGEQVVKHVHVDNRGGQAVIAETVNNGGRGNEKSDDQSHAAGAVGDIAALPRPDPLRQGVPVPSREGEKAMQDARRDESGRA